MRTIDPPPAFTVVRRPGATVWCRPGARAWIEAALDEGRTLHHAAEAVRSQGVSFQGRAPVHVVAPEAGERWAVRHYVRGGFLAPLLGDRYPRGGTPRPFREARVSEMARTRGVATPSILAAAVYPAGLVYRGDLVTRVLEPAADLAELLFSLEMGPARRASLLGRAGAFVLGMGRAGLRHRDLNAKNVLLVDVEEGGRLHVLDLDRASVATGPLPDLGATMLLRLERSLRKWGRRTGRRLGRGEWGALRSGFREAVSDGEDDPARGA